MTLMKSNDELTLTQAVERFTHVTQNISEDDLARSWAWRDYDAEGVRFAFFRTYEELRELAQTILQERQATGRAPTLAQRMLATYHAAFCDMQAALIGLSHDDIERLPAPNEWSAHLIVAHITSADIGFYVAVRHSLDHWRSGDRTAAPLSPDVWESLIGLDEQSFTNIISGPWPDLRSYQQLFHQRVIGEFSSITDEELDLLSYYWESNPLSLRFRLGRFDSHLRQHTIQIDKALAALNLGPGEARRLLRLIHGALAEVEGAGYGAADIEAKLAHPFAVAIADRAAQLADILSLHPAST
ncbi:MAG TPA: DinB family protein [Anaerolineae bacterium]